MRARGAKVTDIVVLVVAADDGVMPQTRRGADHAKAADVPIIVAVNKVDKEEADPQRVRTADGRARHRARRMGRQYEFVDVSAKTGAEPRHAPGDDRAGRGPGGAEGATPTGHARGRRSIEAHLDKGRGPVATVLVQRGDVAAGRRHRVPGGVRQDPGDVRREHGRRWTTPGPAKPVQVLGWSPRARGRRRLPLGRRTNARRATSPRNARRRPRAPSWSISRPPTLSDLMRQAERAEVPELNLIVKADVQGSLGAIVGCAGEAPAGRGAHRTSCTPRRAASTRTTSRWRSRRTAS